MKIVIFYNHIDIIYINGYSADIKVNFVMCFWLI